MNHEVTVSIKDFQIIEKATLTFNKGLNCIIGPSNNGKSAIFRAIMSLLYNEPGTNRIREGCNSYAVGLQMNGSTVLFQKGTKESVYKINGVVYQKPGRVQLEEVGEATGIKELNLNGKNEQLNFWYQMEKPFLLDRSETDLFRFIVDSGKDNRTTLALKDMVSDRQSKNAEVIQLEGRIAQIEDSLKTYDEELASSEYKLSVCNKLIELGPKIKQLDHIKKLIDDLESTGKELEETKHKLETYNRVLGNLNSKMGTLEELTAKTGVYKTLLDNAESYKEELEKQTLKLEKLNSYLKLDYGKGIERIINMNLLVSSLDTIKSKVKEIDTKLKVFSKYDNIKKDDISRVIDMNLLISKLLVMKNSYNNIEVDINSVKSELEDVAKKLKEFSICPLCGRPF